MSIKPNPDDYDGKVTQEQIDELERLRIEYVKAKGSSGEDTAREAYQSYAQGLLIDLSGKLEPKPIPEPIEDPGYEKPGGWGSKSTDASLWKVVPMKDDAKLFKVVDEKQINIATNFKTLVGANAYIEKHKLPPQPTIGKVMHGAMVDVDCNETVDAAKISSFVGFAKKGIATCYFSDWWDTDIKFALGKCSGIKAAGAVPFVRLHSGEGTKPFVNNAGISSGKVDDKLKAYAQACKAFDSTLMLQYGVEVNGDWMEVSKEGPEAYKAAYKHIIDLFRSEGVKNVVWVEQFDVTDNENSPRWYVGDDYIDFVVTSVYGNSNGETGDKLTGSLGYGCIGSLRKGGYERLKAITSKKPLGISEWGLGEAEDTTDTITNLHKEFPDIVLLQVWNEGRCNGTDWRGNIDITPRNLEAYQTAIASDIYTNKFILGPVSPPEPTKDVDQFGVKMIKPTAENGRIRTQFTKEVKLRNYRSGKPSEYSCEYTTDSGVAIQNVEFTCYTKINGFKTNEPDTISCKLGGPAHKENACCWLIPLFMTDGSTKKLMETEWPHPDNHTVEGVEAINKIGSSIIGKWFGYKAISQQTADGKRHVEAWFHYPINNIDDIAKEQDNWKPYFTVEIDDSRFFKASGGLTTSRLDGIEKNSPPDYRYASVREIEAID